MQERLLHFIWQYQYFNKKDLTAVHRQKINILHPGFPNLNAGPDFLNAKVEIDGIVWSGNVEIHVKSSDWLNHKHHLDGSYDSVALHVAWEHDLDAYRRDGTLIPAIELKHKILPSLLQNYNELVNSPSRTPCAGRIKEIDPVIVLSMIERASMQRLESRTEWIHKTLDQKKRDWDEIAYQALAKNMGFKVNSEPFLQLVQALPYKIIGKHANRGVQVEALLFGQAGFLDAPSGDDYYMTLKREYSFLATKYQIQNLKMSRFQWKFLRLRPANFPTIRLAQLAALLIRNRNLFALFRDFGNKERLQESLMAVQSLYWQESYDFGKKAKRPNNGISTEGAENIMINTAAPLLAAYGRASDNEAYIDKAVALLSSLPPENNHVMNLWKDLGIRIKNAFDSQGLLELFNDFCSKKKCIGCSIGMQLLGS